MDELAEHGALEARVVEQARRDVAARLGPPRRGRDGASTRWIRAHWLALFNAAMGIIVAGTFLAPWLRARGHEWLATGVYGFYRLQCLQRPDHSFFVFGEKMGMEQRMVALYASWLAAGLGFALVRDRLRPLSFVALVALSLPMAIDVGSQMVHLRGSSWPWRLSTGALFAVATAWWVLPRAAAVTRGAGRSRPDAATVP